MVTKRQITQKKRKKEKKEIHKKKGTKKKKRIKKKLEPSMQLNNSLQAESVPSSTSYKTSPEATTTRRAPATSTSGEMQIPYWERKNAKFDPRSVLASAAITMAHKVAFLLLTALTRKFRERRRNYRFKDNVFMSGPSSQRWVVNGRRSSARTPLFHAVVTRLIPRHSKFHIWAP